MLSQWFFNGGQYRWPRGGELASGRDFVLVKTHFFMGASALGGNDIFMCTGFSKTCLCACVTHPAPQCPSSPPSPPPPPPPLVQTCDDLLSSRLRDSVAIVGGVGVGFAIAQVRKPCGHVTFWGDYWSRSSDSRHNCMPAWKKSLGGRLHNSQH